MKDEEGEYVFDPWWPGGKFEKLNEENKKAYHQRETVMEWKPSNKEFVEAFRLELEHLYKAVKEEFLAEDLGDEVNAKWTIKNKQKE